MPTVGSHTTSTTDPTSLPSVVDWISSWLTMPASVVDADFGAERERISGIVRSLNERALSDPDARYWQQLLLARIYAVLMRIPDDYAASSAEGSVVLFEVTRLLEEATVAAEDSRIMPGAFDDMPGEGRQYLSWLKDLARHHRVFKHPYYTDFIDNHADRSDLRTYVIQESLVDGRFDDLLAMMQVGTSGSAKLEIAANFWDEMGNGNQEEVHTHLFSKIYDVFEVTEEEMEKAMTASDLLAGNLAVLVCRYRRLYAEAVGFLGMTEWLVPDRFQSVVRAWQRLGLPDAGITYHRLHITIDSQHAAGWFHNVVIPASSSAAMRRGIARGTFWRLNSSARHLDERLANAQARGAAVG
jgi:pyrroloquinoline quinone (PQQ) biosynthesis protein C